MPVLEPSTRSSATPRRIKTMFDRVLNYSEARAAYFAKVTPVDRFLAKTILRYVPERITPNQITVFRFITIPFIIGLLLTGYYTLGTIVFMFSAFSDMLDGARARTTGHITTWGTICDPLADKLLIGSVVIILVSQLISPYLTLGIVAVEALLITSSYFRFKGRAVPAKTVGKIKMVLQCLGIIFLLYFVLSGVAVFLTIATYTLYLALIFALLSLLVYRSV
ncbi:MAG: CDP-alcohol phosphatidyltransferase family protein [Patescibacteria group bacterium]